MTDTVAGPAEKVRFPREIWILVSASFLIAIGYGLIAPALPSYATSFNVGITAASVVVSAFAGVRLAFAPISGRLVTRFGERPIYLWGLTIVAVGSLACAVATEYWQLLLFRSLSGVGSTMFTVSAIGLLIRISPPEVRGRASGLWGTSFLLGGIAGPIIGSALVIVSLRAPFVFYGGALLLTTALVWWQLRNSDLAGRAADSDTPELTFRAALRHPTYRAALASNLTNGWVVLGIRGSLVPLFVTVVLAKGEEFTGLVLAVFAAASAAPLLLVGKFADTKGRRPPALAGLTMMTGGMVLFALASDSWLVLVAVVITGLGGGSLNPSQQASVADVLGSKARGGGVLAGFQMAADVGAVVGPLAAGAIAEQISFPMAFGVSALVAVIALGFWVLAKETLPPKHEGEHTAQDAAVEECPPDCACANR